MQRFMLAAVSMDKVTSSNLSFILFHVLLETCIIHSMCNTLIQKLFTEIFKEKYVEVMLYGSAKHKDIHVIQK